MKRMTKKKKKRGPRETEYNNTKKSLFLRNYNRPYHIISYHNACKVGWGCLTSKKKMPEGKKNARVLRVERMKRMKERKKEKKLVGRLTRKTKNARVLRVRRREMKEKKIDWLFDEVKKKCEGKKNARGSTCEEEK